MTRATAIFDEVTEPRVRTMSQDELPAGISLFGGQLPGAEEDLLDRSGLCCLRERVGWVAEVKGRPAGTAICALLWPMAPRGVLASLRRLAGRMLGRCPHRPLRVELLDVATLPGPCAAAAERALLGQLVDKLKNYWCCAVVIVPESKLAAQLVLRDAQYKAIRILHAYYGSEDGYLMLQYDTNV